MGKVVTMGKATRLVPYDTLVTTVVFHSEKTNTQDAIRQVLHDSEQFLDILETSGFSLQMSEARDNKISKQKYGDEKLVEATRQVVFRTKYDLSFVDQITRLIGEYGFEADLDFSSSVSNIKTIKDELVGEAVSNAMTTAEAMVKVMGMTISGLERMKIENSGSRYYDEFDDLFWDYEGPKTLSKGISVEGGYEKLSPPKTTVKVEVFTEWNID